MTRQTFLQTSVAGVLCLSSHAPTDDSFADERDTIPQEQKPLIHQHTLTGDIRTYPDFSSKFLEKSHTVLVYLPPGYSDAENAQRRYPVLYLHDGQNVFDGATSFIPGKEWQVDETAERLIREGQIEPLVIVAVYNGGAARAYEYTPTFDTKFNGGMGGGANEYGRMLVEELKPFVDTTYRTLKTPEATGLGGSSFGGLVTLHLALRYPEVFRRIAVVSPSVWWDGRYLLRAVQGLKVKPPLKIWLDIGTREGQNALRDTQLLRDALVSQGWTIGKDLSYREEEGAVHDEAAWAKRVEPILKFLYPKRL
jgi:predicted alpha/beta superfamily hydrolase